MSYPKVLLPDGFLGSETPQEFSIVELKKLFAGPLKGVDTSFVPNSSLLLLLVLSPSNAAYANCKSTLPDCGVLNPVTGIVSVRPS
ncbi:hypothetical protein D3C72_1345720 [compost metagenome]